MMRPGVPTAQALRELWFWTEIMRDHTLFIMNATPPSEAKVAEWANSFHQTFQGLLAESEQLAHSAGIAGPAGSYALKGPPEREPLAAFQGAELGHYAQGVQRLSQRTLEAMKGLRGFKEELLQRKLECTVALGLPPDFIAHMINELDEGYRAVSGAREAANLPPALEALHHHLLWLPDASGHAWALHSGLDGPEAGLQKVTMDFKQIFDGMQIKAMELYAMLRIAPRMVGALRRLNRDAMGEIAIFRAFLAELREHLEGCEVMGILLPILPDHMLREELYYTEKVQSIDYR